MYEIKHSSQQEIDSLIIDDKDIKPHIISDSSREIISSLGYPDLPVLLVIDSGKVVFSSKANESLKQNLYRFFQEQNTLPGILDQDSEGGTIPCAK